MSSSPLSKDQPAGAGRRSGKRGADPTAVFRPEELYSTFHGGPLGQWEGFSGWGLVVERGSVAGRTYGLSEGTTRVGRHMESHILLDDITVSRRHCRLQVKKNRVTVEDEGSTNGTYVNGSRMEVASLQPGDRLVVGRFHLLVVRGP